MKETYNQSTTSPSRHITFRVQQTQGEVLVCDLSANLEGIKFTITMLDRKPQAPLHAYVVRDLKNGLAWTEIDGFGVSPICGFDQIPTLVQTVTDTAIYLGQNLDWQDDRDTE